MFFKRGLAVGGVLAMSAVTAPLSAAAPAEWSDPGRVVTVAKSGAEVSIDLGPDGTLYVVDLQSGELSAVDSGGRITRVPGTEQLNAVDADAVEGAVYVVTQAELWRVADGQATLLFGELTSARSVAVDAAGNAYVADAHPAHSKDGRIRKIAPDRTITTVAGDTLSDSDDERVPVDGAPAAGTPLACPGGLTIDTQGRLFFTHRTEQLDNLTVWTIDAGGAIRAVPGGGVGFGSTEVDNEGLAVGPDGRVYVLDTVRKVGGVRVLGPNGERSSAGPNVLEPEGVAVRPDGGVYVAAGGRILLLRDQAAAPRKYPPSADPWVNEEPGTVETVGAMSPGRGTLEDLAVGTDSAIHVVENGLLHTLPSPFGTGQRQSDFTLAGTRRVAPAADGALYVQVGNLVVLKQPDEQARPILVGGPPETDGFPNKLASPVTNTAGAGRRLYVSDENGSVRVLERDGSLRQVVDGATEVFTVTPAGVVYYYDGARVTSVGPGARPLDVAVDDVRDLAVAPDGTVYLATGDGVRAIGPGNTVDTVVPEAANLVAVDPHGNVYFAGRSSVRVLVRPGQVEDGPTEPDGSVDVTLVVLAVGVLAVAGFVAFRVRRARARRVTG